MMGSIRIEQADDALVIHFQSDRERINAYTLASVLVSVADAAKAANATLNPGYDVEIVVDAIGPGSFRAKLRAVYTKARNVFSDQRVQAIVLGIVSNFIYDRTLATRDGVAIDVKSDEVVIVRGNDRVIVPRNIYDATRSAQLNPEFVRAVSRTIESVAEDEQVTALGFVQEMTSPPPEVVLTKQELQDVAITEFKDPLFRITTEQCDLQILRAILEKSRRKWEFVWRGFRIAAPIVDDRFYVEFSAHKITIAPGDILRVRLAIKQSHDPATGIYTNHSYEVVEVIEHVAGTRQMPLTPDHN